MNTAWDAYLQRTRHAHGNRLDLSDVAESFLPYFNGPRVKVTTDDGLTRTGRVSITTGWRPALLLVHRSSDHGSSDLLSDRDRIVAVQQGREYRPVRSAPIHYTRAQICDGTGWSRDARFVLVQDKS